MNQPKIKMNQLIQVIVTPLQEVLVEAVVVKDLQAVLLVVQEVVHLQAVVAAILVAEQLVVVMHHQV